MVIVMRPELTGFICAWRTSSACPPEKKPQEYRFGERSERHAKVQKQQRPHIDSSKSNKKARDDSAQ